MTAKRELQVDLCRIEIMKPNFCCLLIEMKNCSKTHRKRDLKIIL